MQESRVSTILFEKHNCLEGELHHGAARRQMRLPALGNVTDYQYSWFQISVDDIS